ncbi:hypothetical protein [Stigmatella aurantiaca]|uniref:YXWGXW repeat-containing protein n=1 Tax=Stigmatella aurantiaca (strain DW4/3-1) TaxID=378806 RepID=E3FDA9_STIAD|nr:hypothetical protein [Stigmatella aurantiaca]ADO68788.1 uncharacterized protein STAUR_0984 [Stigmatella aurantiaca DW4/3-1]
MALKSGIVFLALGTLFLGSSALAQGGYGGHGGPSHHRPQPPRPSNQEGRYELQTVQEWSPGRYEKVWVPEECRYRPRRGVQQCQGGYYEQRWVPGRYETVEKWVWVPGRYHRYGRS